MNRKIENGLFWFQLIAAWTFSLPQIIQLTKSHEGITAALFILFFVFMLINLTLSWRAYKANPDRSRWQAVIIYINWVILIGGHLVVLWDYEWRNTDTYFMLVVAVATALTLVISKLSWGLGYSDSVVRGVVACWCKSLPQFYLGYCIWVDSSGNGLATITVWVGHLTIFTRIAHIIYGMKSGGFDRNVAGLLLAEGANSLSWIVATAVWLYYK